MLAVPFVGRSLFSRSGSFGSGVLWWLLGSCGLVILCLGSLSLSSSSTLVSAWTVTTTTTSRSFQQQQQQRRRPISSGSGKLFSSSAKDTAGSGSSSCSHLKTPSNVKDDDDTTKSNANTSMVMVERSTLTLLEHVNLNVPSQEPYVLSFYFDLLGCGLDPRKAANLYHHHQSNNNDASNTKTQKPTTIWANCGSSQFHLPYGGVPQRIYGTVGLRFRADRWEAFRDRVQAELAPRMNHPKGVDPGVSSSASGCCCIKACETGTDREGCDFVRLTDQYDNVFFCRPDFSADVSILDSSERKRLLQPIISPTDTEQWGKEVTARFGRHETDCSGIDYVEFKCPRGTADKIALFYDSVLDATVNVVQDKEDKVAVIALGNVDASTGRADQSLLFRETDEVIPPYDGHHVAMYVGESAADFEQAYRHAEIAGVVWVNPRFSDKADTLNAARHWKQFRFKDVVDMETGEKIFELEHEMRSIEHEAWLGNIH